tara:strand:- start:9556 stop:10644 length:1089 start_codon:yes stop_codon:yes gene_type:complete
MSVKNITSLDYFLNRWDMVDPEYNYTVPYYDSIDPHFASLPTFVAEFHDCKVHTCPLLLTRENRLITDHVWKLTHKSRHKPEKSHALWSEWGDSVDLLLPPVSESFNENNTYVWLPVDEASAENPWHVWIDVISKFRLIEKRWSTNFNRYCFVLANQSKYFEKVCKALFPEVKIVVMPKGSTWRFKHLIVPSMSNSQDGIIVPPAAPWLRHFKGLKNLKGVTQHRKIVVLRPGATTRKLINSDELLLKLKGWETVALEKMSIKQQMQTFAEASHILAAHGAGLVNLLWCQPGTKVIEIQDKNMIHKKVYPLLAHNLNLEHKLYLADVVPIARKNNAKLPGVKRFSDMINFKINIPDIMEHLE